MLARPVELQAPAPSFTDVCAKPPSPELITPLPLASFQVNPEMLAFSGSGGVGVADGVGGMGEDVGGGCVGGMNVDVGSGCVGGMEVDVAEAASCSWGANVAVMSKISGVPITSTSLQVNCAGMPKSDTDTK